MNLKLEGVFNLVNFETLITFLFFCDIYVLKLDLESGHFEHLLK